MIADKFRPVADYFIRSGIEPDAVNKHLDSLYTRQSGVFNVHLLMESKAELGAADFRNVVYNVMMKLAVVDALATMLDVDSSIKEDLERATVMRNLTLHVDKRPNDYKDETRELLLGSARSYGYNQAFYEAAGPEFFTTNRVDSPYLTIGEKIMLLDSDLVDERETGKPTIMNVDDHIDFKIEDRPDLDSFEYWERERKMDHQFIRELFPDIAPELLPLTIIQQIAINAEKSLLS